MTKLLPPTPPPPKTLLEARSYRARSWRMNPREALHSAWRYSIFVTIMKSALPIVAIGLGVAVLSYVLQPREQNRSVLTFEKLGRVEDDLAMIKPQLTGTDNDGFPFTVTAQTAVQDAHDMARVHLEGVNATIALKNGGNLHVTAARGLADTKTHMLDISGGIHMVSDDGYDVRTESASADLKSGTVQGETPIEANSALGHVTAERFAFDRSTKQLHFSGNVRMVMYGVMPKQKGRLE
jgi:lipopolysaccharide export system protein LptC